MGLKAEDQVVVVTLIDDDNENNIRHHHNNNHNDEDDDDKMNQLSTIRSINFKKNLENNALFQKH